MIGQKVLDLCKLKGLTLRAACQASGLKYSTLHAQISNRRPIPFKTIDKLARTLNAPLSFFSDGSPLFQFAASPNGGTSEVVLELEQSINDHSKTLSARGHHISIDNVLDWLVQNDFQLKNFDWLKESVDLYYPLKEGEIMAHTFSAGPQSLATQILGFSDQIDPDIYYGKFDPKDLQVIRLSHRQVEQHKYSITDQPIEVVRNGMRLSGVYRKLMAGVRDEDGTGLTLVFCRIVRFTKS
ncbi:helix-turn-helix domain-containing protein [Lentibacter algarum]|jgi:transcriptional regulator with XRE-family HTH domain|uniref:helix-turn-helix domain-containing protein n=2 Tax=Lentibacter algarum TaxID=576131 RepID=UPI0023A87890|nr:helix-turn-helix transcriptional regulator [Lentibacter algarum]